MAARRARFYLGPYRRHLRHRPTVGRGAGAVGGHGGEAADRCERSEKREVTHLRRPEPALAGRASVLGQRTFGAIPEGYSAA